MNEMKSTLPLDALIKGLHFDVPIIGAIRIGDLVTAENGATFPLMMDSMVITQEAKDAEDRWYIHPLHERLLESTGLDSNKDEVVGLKSIPIKFVYNKPELNICSNYIAFDDTSRPECVGNGENAVALSPSGEPIQRSCAGPARCSYPEKVKCAQRCRLFVRIDGQEDEFGAFIFRTSSWNTMTDVALRMAQYSDMLGDLLRFLPLSLVIQKRCSGASNWANFYFLTIKEREGFSFVECVNKAKEEKATWDNLGINWTQIDLALPAGRKHSNMALADASSLQVQSQTPTNNMIEFESAKIAPQENKDDSGANRVVKLGLAGLRS